jgi:putative glutamine amidotransferase
MLKNYTEGKKLKKLVGIIIGFDEAAFLSINRAYPEMAAKAGLTTVLLPPTAKAEVFLPHLGGLILVGGNDVDPRYFGEPPQPLLGNIDPERDAFEINIVKKAYAAGLPILGICRGMQVINVALGGSLWQDLSYAPDGEKRIDHNQKAPRNHPYHDIQIFDEAFAMHMGDKYIAVNSTHHQAVGELAPELEPLAISADGIIEAFRSKKSFCLGVQWHPEWLEGQAGVGVFTLLAEAIKK